MGSGKDCFCYCGFNVNGECDWVVETIVSVTMFNVNRECGWVVERICDLEREQYICFNLY